MKFDHADIKYSIRREKWTVKFYRNGKCKDRIRVENLGEAVLRARRSAKVVYIISKKAFEGV